MRATSNRFCMLFLLATLNGGCRASSSTDTTDVCVPGATQTCTGPGSCKGGQQCDADGKAWGACDCGNQTGGSGGADSGGTSGLAGGQTTAASTEHAMGGRTSGVGGNASGGTSSGGGTTSSNSCSALAADYCSCLPAFSGTQVVDGAGDEFAQIPAMTFALSSAPYTHVLKSLPVDEVISVRAGWSDLALHLHVHIEDPSIAPDTASTLWNGDNVQFFAAGTDVLTGAYTGTEDGGALHVLVSAPTTSSATQSVVIFQNGVSTTAPFTNGAYAGRRVTDGYEIELQLLWSNKAEARKSGARIGFDLVVGSATLTSGGLVLEGGLANNPVTSSVACTLGGRVHPGCDDRTWCTPMLQ